MPRELERNRWYGMIQRCENPRSVHFARYGGRGIGVCRRWRDSYDAFLADMGRAPSPKHSIDRINNDGNYEPGNCRWATAQEQQRNRRNNVLIPYQGRKITQAELCELSGLPQKTVEKRRMLGWSAEKIIHTPVKPAITDAHVSEAIDRLSKGESLTSIAKSLGFHRHPLRIRIDQLQQKSTNAGPRARCGKTTGEKRSCKQFATVFIAGHGYCIHHVPRTTAIRSLQQHTGEDGETKV